MKLRAKLSINEVMETYINGNISDTKIHIQRMTKMEFLDFIEIVLEYGIKQTDIKKII